MKKIITIIFLILLLCSCGEKPFEQTDEICIVYTNDVASAIDGEIGYAGVKGFKDTMSQEYRYVALVDAGDYYDGELSRVNGARDICDLMNAVGYDVVTLGNQEFSIGLDALSANLSESDFDTVSCNLKYNKTFNNPLKRVEPYVIKNFGVTKIAFVGVTTPETLIPNKPAHDAIFKDGKFLYSFYEGNDGQDLYKQVQKNVDKVRKKVDYVIVLAHLGSNSVTEGFSSYDLIHNTTGIDVVIDGHSHTVISGEGVENKEGQMVVLTSTGQKIENVGQLMIHTDHTYTTVLYPVVDYKDAFVQDMVNSILSR